MDFSLSDEQEKFRQELRTFLNTSISPELEGEIRNPAVGVGLHGKQFIKKLSQNGYLGIGWPKEYGGGQRSAIDQWLFNEEMAYRGAPTGDLTLTSVGPTIMAVANDPIRNEYLPAILRGDVLFALGYTEPNAGTDLASLQTRAVRDGDEYVINGQKIFTSHAHFATHVWLLTRTDPKAPKHRGISLFIVPMSTPGITVRPLITQSGLRTNEVFYEDVRVPATNLVGEENRGWYYATMALDYERLFAYSGHKRNFERLVDYARKATFEGQPLSKDPRVRRTLARLAVDLEVLRLFSTRAAWMIEHKIVPNAEASINKIWGSELSEHIADSGLNMMGAYGVLERGEELAPIGGHFAQYYLGFPVGKFGGGTNEIQRNIIAQRGLKMPRG